MDIKELKKKKEEIEKQIKEEQKKILDSRGKKAKDEIDAIPEEHRKIILKYMKHDRTSCSDDDPCNGYSCYTGTFRCRKCMLMEIFIENYGDYEFELVADLTPITLEE